MNNYMATPQAAKAHSLREFLRPDACIKGTPMVPLHRDTLEEIIVLLEDAHKAVFVRHGVRDKMIRAMEKVDPVSDPASYEQLTDAALSCLDV